MDDEKILENNKLIAEFMTTYEDDDQDCNFGHIHSPFYGGAGAMWSKHSKAKLIPQLKYHSSWDWLVPVLEKIGNILNEDRYICRNTSIWFNDKNSAHLDFEEEYLTVICFIKFYNNVRNK